jgi:hypothetical protein
MTVSKTALTVTSLAMALMFGGGVYLFMNMNILAKSYIERSASETLGVKVSLGGLNINLKERSARATHIVVHNPPGFTGPDAVEVAAINVVLGNMSKQLVSMKDVDVDGTLVNLEVKENTTNLATISNNIKAAPPSQTKEAIKVIINKMALSGAKIQPIHVLFTDSEVPPVQLPPITLSGIGEKENGVLVNDAIAQVFNHIARKAQSEALNAGLLNGMSDDALKDMGLNFTQRFKENLKETVQEKVDSVNEGINKMFND